MNEEILKEILKEMAKPRKYEQGYAEARRIINDGLVILGMSANDILGFAKEANETRARRSKGAQGWFKKMNDDGWRYAGNFEYEGLLHKGFVIMEREVPNKRLEQLIERLNTEKILIRPDEPMSFIPDVDKELPGLLAKPGSLKKISMVSKDPALNKIGPVREAYLKELEKVKASRIYGHVDSTKEPMKGEGVGIKDVKIIPKNVLEPKEGFESEINDFIQDAQKEMKTLEEIFFDETGRNAVWRGNETKAFKNWKEKQSE